ncbi:hypothetical protein NUW58_g6470 [Xylaria curta]|uniref:Uncharacterized protein n=1 Tax=Xylaria curta TaxID=42375 RepID=A0ACC1NSP7_9PEZI|nr:hypothetical protein NUW58_g6470 [Xylaria curta]
MEDYDLGRPVEPAQGMRQGLTSYGDAHFSLFLRKVFIKALGYSEDALSRPIVGIVNTYSSFNPCHANIPQLIDAVKRGVQLAGGLAIDFPTISLHESFAAPTSMFLRNLMSMDTEEMIRAQPVDAVVLIGGCDKTTPAQLMGGISANKPILHLVTGPMMPGSHRGVRIGACTDCRNNWASYRAGAIDIEEIGMINEELAPTAGTCGVMGTASTMACILVALGMMPLKGASAPAVSSARLRIAEQTGGIAVSMIKAGESLKPQALLTRESFLNAITVLQAIGGSTNAVVHLMAIINRHPHVAGSITLDTVDEIGRKDAPARGPEAQRLELHDGLPQLGRHGGPAARAEAAPAPERHDDHGADARPRSWMPSPPSRSPEPSRASRRSPTPCTRPRRVVLRGNLAPRGAS